MLFRENDASSCTVCGKDKPLKLSVLSFVVLLSCVGDPKVTLFDGRITAPVALRINEAAFWIVIALQEYTRFATMAEGE
jgi:hypothetical protein